MSFKIAIASGKGGTGKTTVSVNLSYFTNKYITEKVLLVDCDVEEPNDKLFFPAAKTYKKEDIEILIPEIRLEKCNFCRKCVEYCEFNAIVVIPPVEFAEVNKSLCHSCGACTAACSFDAIIEKPFKIGEYQMYQNTIGDGLVEGKLEIGSAMQTMLIRKLKKQISDKHDIIIYDAPPGTSCPVVETISDSDYVILVTEPTPFGLYDLKLMVALMKEINISYGVIVNKSGLGYDATYNFLESEKIELLGNIPYMKEYASLYSNGDLLSNIPPEMEKTYTNIIHKLENKLTLYERNNHIER